MSDLGPSVAEISQARNQKLQQEAGVRGQQMHQDVQQDTAQLADELQDAHLAAMHIKDTIKSDQDTKQTQAFPHGPMMSNSLPSSGHGPSMTQKLQAAQADLYSMAKNQASVAGEAIKGTIASADQVTTTKLRGANAAVSEKVSGAVDGGVGLAAQTVGLLDRAKEAVKGVLGLSGGAGEAEGSAPATAYEGVVFASDDPEYQAGDRDNKHQAGAAKGGDVFSSPASHVAVEVGGTTESVSKEPETGRPATEQLAEGKASQQGNKGTGSSTGPSAPRLTLGELKGSTLQGEPAGTSSSSSGPVDKPKQPIISSPKEEPGSLGEGSVGVAAGDPAGGASIVAASRTAGKGIMDILGLGHASAPAGPPPEHPDPQHTAGVAVGDFKGLKEALEAARDTKDSSGGAGSGASTQSGTAAESAVQAAAATDSGGSTDTAPGVDPGAAKQGYQELKDSAQQGLESAAQVASDAASGAGTSASGAGGGILSGLASLVSDIATKVNLANSSEELLAGGIAVADESPGSSAAGSDTTQQPAREAVLAVDAATGTAGASKDAAAGAVGGEEGGRMSKAAGDTAAAAKDAAGDTAAASKDTAGDNATAAKDAAGDVAAAAKEAASDAAGCVQVGVKDAIDHVKAGVANAAEAVVNAMEVEGMGGSGLGFSSSKPHTPASPAAAAAGGNAAAGGGDKVLGQEAAATTSSRVDEQGSGESLVQGAKDGLVGAYDAAAGAASSAADIMKDAAGKVTGSSSGKQQQGQGQHGPDERRGCGFGHGSGSSSSPSGGGYAGGEGSSLGQAWEDLKHGGSKAPHTVSNAGETAAPQDVTSNVERSKHLDDPQQAKIYDAEVYRVSPGSQVQPLSDQEKQRAEAGAVAGDKRQVTGAVPHSTPGSSKVTPGQPTRFQANKGMASGFGTGSATGWSDDSVKRATSHFVSGSSSSSSSGAAAAGLAAPAVLDIAPGGSLALPRGFSHGEQQALVDAAAQAAAATACTERADSSSEAAVCSWVSSMAAVWDNLGKAAAKGPTGEDVPKNEDFFDNPTQDVMVDPVRGPVTVEGASPGHKVMMRPPEQLPTGGSSSDPHMVANKVERLSKAIKDSLTTSSDQAAADPDNLKGKSSNNKPDGTELWLKQEVSEAASSLAAAPEKVAEAMGTAAEIGGGVLQHIGQKVGDAAYSLAQPGSHSSGTQARQERAEAGVARVAARPGVAGPVEPSSSIPSISVGAGGAGDMQHLQESRMVAIEAPTGRRETLGDKVMGPLMSGVRDDTHARELAASYQQYKAEQEQGGKDSGPTPGTSPAAIYSSASPSGSSTPSSSSAADQQGQQKGHTSTADEAKGVAQAATDAAAHTAGKASGRVQSVVEGVRGTARETTRGAADAAAAAGDVAAHEAKGAAQATIDAAAHTAGKASCKVQAAREGVRGATRDTVREAGDTAAAAGDVAKMELQCGVESAAHSAGWAAGSGDRKLEEGKEQAAAAGEAAGSAAASLLSSVGGAAKSLLGGLLGPFEREAAFEESTAVVSGTPPTPELVAVEQPSERGATGDEASRAAGRDVTERNDSGRSMGAGAGAGAGPGALCGPVPKVGEHKGAAAAPPAGDDAMEVGRLQADVDDAVRAAGLAAGHLGSSAEIVAQKVAAARETVKAQLAAATEGWEVPPAELPSNTEEIISIRQHQQWG